MEKNGNAKIAANGTKNGSANGNGVKVLETVTERKERIVSLGIVYFTLFLQSLGLAIVMTGVWPFLTDVRFKICLI
jgi:hypothetical protein